MSRRTATRLRRIPGVQANATNAPSFGERGGRPVEFVLQTSGTYEQLQEYADKILAEVEDSPVLTIIDTDLKLNKPEFTVRLNRPKVADLGLDVAVVGRTLETLLGGRQVTRFDVDGEQFDVYIRRGGRVGSTLRHLHSARRFLTARSDARPALREAPTPGAQLAAPLFFGVGLHGGPQLLVRLGLGLGHQIGGESLTLLVSSKVDCLGERPHHDPRHEATQEIRGA